ncbi:MAG: riboflavin biosynthesis protein RibF, partial [Verrucomicrobia bacterium]|nr:riboflavin biosynthesis protein RibF [Verrucomicrobiota bacterium]
RESGGVAGVVTFEPHPIQVLAPGKAPRRILASLEHKERLLEALGVSVVVVLPFTAEFARREAREFAGEMFGCAPDLRQVTVGEDWKFGHDRGGSAALLREWGEEAGVLVEAAAPVMAEGERISSTRIRQAIRDGNLGGAAAMLGREFSVYGVVAHGRQLGGKIGVPTANIEVGDEQLPPDGVYVVQAEVGGVLRKGVGNLGMRPTVGAERRLLEVHLFDFAGDLYGQEMEVWFGAYLRGEEKFKDVEALKVQIGKDLARARGF